MKKLTKIIPLSFPLFLFVCSATAQTLHIESGTLLHIEHVAAIDGAASATPLLYVGGDIQNNGSIENNGELQLTGNITNNGTYTSTGDDVFVGNANQNVNGDFTGANAFYNLVLDKSGTSLTALNNIDIEEGIYLTNGVLIANGNTLHLKNTAGNAVHSTAPSGAANNFIDGVLKQDITTGQTYTFYNGDAVHGNQKAVLFFNNTGGASNLDISYNNATAGAASIPGCGGVFDSQTGTWTITANGTNGTYDYNITLVPGGANLAAISSGVYDGSLKDGVFITDPCANTLGNFSANNLNGFSQFKIAATTNAALPVTLTSFTGRKLNTSDILNWSTASEHNNAFFTLQHSVDGIQFSTIAKVNTAALNGNSATTLHYTHTNPNPVSGHNYYRLQQTDIDGKTTIQGEVVELFRNAENTTIHIYPNPAKDILNVEVNTAKAKNTSVKISDMSGRVIKQIMAKSDAGVNIIKVNIAELAAGMYTVQVYENEKLTGVSKFRKSN